MEDVKTNSALAQEVPESIMGAVARGWCADENSHKVMDSDLAVAIAREVTAILHSTALRDNEQYRLQMAAISTAAIGYCKTGDPITPEYDTMALRDVQALYDKYAALHAVTHKNNT